MALTKATNSMISGAYINVLDFGATGDGTTDDTVAIQAALDSATSGGVVYFPSGEYRIARNIGTNDRWGIKVTNSNVTLKGEQASFRRYNTDISTYALAYPILFVGVPDSNVAAATTNVVVEGITFIGEDTRHSATGDALPDERYAIEFKNTNRTLVSNCVFTKIDSSAIWYQYPVSYDYVAGIEYNLTKNYNTKVIGCSFIAEEHSTTERALIHAVDLSGVDFSEVSNNYFEWCDDAVHGSGTYYLYTQTEDDTYTSVLGATKRCGRNSVISNNVCFNSSEHVFYMSNMDCVVSGNNIRTSDPSICISDIKIRAFNASVTGNTLSNCGSGISITEAARDVSVIGNTINVVIKSSDNGGVIDVSSDNLSTYLNARSSWTSVGGSVEYLPMSNIVINGNTITMQEDAAASTENQIAFRIYTSTTDANYPEGQLQNIKFNDNTISNYNVGIYCINDLVRNFTIDGNSFFAKPFTTSGFNSGTTLNTRAVVQARQSGAGGTLTSMSNATFVNNYVYGATYLIATHTASGTSSTYYLPIGFSSNRLNYVKNIKTADVREFGITERFRNNTGVYFLDRTWGGSAMENSLGDGTASDSYKRYCTMWTGSQYLFYTDDAGTYVALS